MPLIVPARLAALVLAFSFSVSPLLAQEAPDTQDAQVWVQALAVGPVSENWRAHLELQPRWFDDASELGLVMMRAAIGRRIAPRATAWVGYAGVPRTQGEGTRYEQRLWQQLTLDVPAAGRWATIGRIRLEQRWQEPWADNSHRIRLLARTQRPLASSPWTVALYDEVMITFDDTESGPARGYDRNRVYGGLMRRVSPAFTAEFGYIWENSPSDAGHRNDHIAIGVLNLGLFRRR